MRWQVRIRRFLSTPNGSPGLQLFHHHTSVFWRSQLLIRAFYAFVAFLAIKLISDWPGVLIRQQISPLWPIFWLSHVGNMRQGIMSILIFFTGAALLGAALPQFRIVRCLTFLGMLEFWAFNNSLGKIGHSMHGMLLVSFVFMFLPTGWGHNEQRTRCVKQSTLLIFWTAQATLMLTYSMAGLIKCFAGIQQFCLGQPNIFRPDAMARHVADRLLETNSTSWFGAWLIDHQIVAYPLMLGTVYLELFSFLTMFRPRLQLAFSMGLVLFHVASYFAMTIIFPENCFLLFLFFAGMPLLRGQWNWKEFAFDWPVLGDLAKVLSVKS